MTRPGPALRLATPADAEPVHRIYAPVVRATAISFEYVVPSVEEMGRRITDTLGSGFPWLVAEEGGQVSGYAYASPFRSRAAYAWSVEVSVYVDPEHHRRGVGRTLYAGLFGVLEAQGFRGAYAISTTPNAPGEGLHRSVGFEPVGRFPRVGFKFGQWHDVLCWYRPLGPVGGEPSPTLPVGEALAAARPEASRQAPEIDVLPDGTSR
jgi:L-amino acid N-acyltransferase YncA